MKGLRIFRDLNYFPTRKIPIFGVEYEFKTTATMFSRIEIERFRSIRYARIEGFK